TKQALGVDPGAEARRAEMKRLAKADKSMRKAAKTEKKAPKKAEAKQADDSLKIRLYAKGEFYFGKLAAARINSLPYIAVEAKGKTVTLTPTKSSKDTVKVGFCHASPVLRVAKVLAETGWSKTTQDLVAKPVGKSAFQVE